MASLAAVWKRLFVGRPLRSERLSETLLPKRLALPVFASDALSSVAYATQEILLVLSLGGLAFYHYSPYIAAGVVFLMLVVVASYRQNVHAYPSGGGDYEVVTTNLGPRMGVVVASALLVDYVLTVAVSISSAVANLTSAITSLQGHETSLAVAVVVLVTVMNLRGVRESGSAFAVPSYLFIAAVFTMIALGVSKIVAGNGIQAESADWEVEPEASFAGLALAFLLLRSFASGCTALTGVEAISNGVPAFRPPKSKNAATTLALLGGLAVTMFMGVTFLALKADVHVAETNADLVGLPPGEEQRTVIAQIGAAVFGNNSIGFFFLQTCTVLILALAANTAFNGFPVLGSILARDGYLPRQLHTRGDRLAFSNGIITLAGLACILIIAFKASPTHLIQLYIVGVFVSFTCSQTGMVRHWNRHLRTERDPQLRARMKRTRVINMVGAAITGLVLVIVLITKFLSGAWIAVLAGLVLYVLMNGIHRHYQHVARELVADAETPTLPSRVHAFVLISKLHKPTLRALAFARATRPDSLVGLTVNVDAAETRALQAEWDRRDIPVPLVVLDSPFREITRPILRHVRETRRSGPRDVVVVYLPEYVVGKWWEHLLHNQSALRLKTRLLFTPGVMVCSVPWQLSSSKRPGRQRERPAPGQLRRGVVAEEIREGEPEATSPSDDPRAGAGVA